MNSDSSIGQSSCRKKFIWLHLQVSKWEKQLLDIHNSVISCKRIGRIQFTKDYKIANGSNGSQVFLGLVDNQTPVAVKRSPGNVDPRDRELIDILNKQVSSQNIYGG